MSHTQPFGAAAARDALDPALETEDMTDELLTADGRPLVSNSEDLFADATPSTPAEREVVPDSSQEQDTAVDAVPVPELVEAVMVDEEGIIGELPPPSRADIDLSVDDIVARAERADDFLRKWRTTSVDRSVDWEAEEAVRMQLEAQRRGWFYLGAAGGVTAVLLGFAGLLATGVVGAAGVAVATSASADAPATKAPVDAPATAAAVDAPVAAPIERPADPVVAEGVADAPEAVEAPAAAPAEAVAVPEKPVAEAEAPRARVVLTPNGGADALPKVLADGSTWVDGGFRWAAALVADEGVELAWFDAAGQEVLDRVACSGRDVEGFRCLSGRSPKRIAWALEQGAERGLWTVKACRGAGCVVLGTTQVD